MKVSDWSIFEWHLESLLSTQRPKLPPFVFRQATPDDRSTIEKVLLSAISQEPAISHKSDLPILSAEESCEIAFASSSPACVVVQHGSRIIGASVLNPAPDAANHLLSGPSILHEYRNRGIGSALLFTSLEYLKDTGLTRAIGYARNSSTAARFIYPKFGGSTVLPVTKHEENVPDPVGV